MSTKNDGGPAYPVAFTTTPLQGMTLRDWFAGQVLCHNAEINTWSRDEDVDSVVAHCYRVADAMLKERSK